MNHDDVPPRAGHNEGDPGAPPDAPDVAAVIEQVRELLFGEHRRATEGSLKGLEDRIAALTATIEARFADLERRLNDSRIETDQTRDHNVQSLGAALKEIGERIQSLVAKP